MKQYTSWGNYVTVETYSSRYDNVIICPSIDNPSTHLLECSNGDVVEVNTNEIKQIYRYDELVKQIDYILQNEYFGVSDESYNNILNLADYTEDHIGHLLNKFLHMNKLISDHAGLPMLKQVKELLV